MGNLDHWNHLKRAPENMLRPIQAGRLKGKSDISPQWRYQAMTEEFGPIGIGWKYTIDKVWREEGDKGIIFAFAQVTVYTKDGDKWSEGIPGVGGSKLVDSESKGMYSNDEGYKMAITDALSVALKMIGVAADVYLGLWDGSKYITNGEPSDEEKASCIKQIQACRHLADLGALWGKFNLDYKGTEMLKELAKEKDAMKEKLNVPAEGAK